MKLNKMQTKMSKNKPYYGRHNLPQRKRFKTKKKSLFRRGFDFFKKLIER